MKLKSVAPLLLTAAILVGSGLFVFSTLTSDAGLVVETTNEGIRILHEGKTLLPGEEFTIRFADVTEVALMHELPKMRRTNGLGNSVVQIGAFSSEDLGDFRCYVWAKKAPHLFIRTAAGAYLVTPEDAEALFAILSREQ